MENNEFEVPFLTYEFKTPDYSEAYKKPKNEYLFTDFMDISVPQQRGIDYSQPTVKSEDLEEKTEEKEKTEESKKQSVNFPTGTMTNDRKKLIEEMQRQGFSQDEINYYDKLAGKESSWRNHPGVNAGKGRSARGYFQFLDSTLQGLGINKKASEMSIAEQVAAIKKFTENNRKQLAPYLEQAKKLGYSEWGVLGGAHLGGVGGVTNFLKTGKSATDNLGTGVSTYMKLFS